MKNEKVNNRRTRGWAWREHGIRFGKSDSDSSQDFVDRELELIQIEQAIKDNAPEPFEETS